MMKRIAVFLWIVLLVAAFPANNLMAQDSEQDGQGTKHVAAADSMHTTHASLDELVRHASDKVIPLETADNMLKDARSYSLDGLNDEQADKLMKVYKIVAESYAANVRYKPAYIVYDEYIHLKNSFLMRKKDQRLKKIAMETNQIKDDNALKISANEGQITSLQSENESLTSAKSNVYRTIWVVVLLVAFFSGGLIWYINHKYMKAKDHLTANRNRMTEVAFTSAIGEFNLGTNGNGNSSYLNGLEQIKNDLSKLSDSLSSQGKEVKDLTTLLSRLKESISKL